VRVVSFYDVQPIPRYDGVVWTHVTIGEAAGEAGPFTIIDNITLTPVDTDPAHPMVRQLTTENAALDSGWYQLTFVDASGDVQQPVVPLWDSPEEGQAWLCTVYDVALKDLSRTRDSYGNLAGTFNQETAPTDDQVIAMIQRLGPAVADAIGDDIPVALYDDAQNVLATRVAMQIELDYYPDQVNTGRSIYPQLEKMYETELARLQTAVQQAEAGGGTVDPTGPSLFAQGSFPTTPMTIRDEVW
jgi:hypothetical protein